MIDPRVERMLQETERQSALPKWAADSLREAVTSSPVLADLMRKAVESGDLRHISVASTPNEGGHFNAATRSISINSSVFLQADPVTRIDLITGVLGHETGHALMARSSEFSTTAFTSYVESSLGKAAASGAATADITEHTRNFVKAFRQNEAFAELVSMNAVASRVKHEDPDIDREMLMRRLEGTSRCFANGHPAPGIHLDPNGMQRTRGNIDSPAVNAVAVCHFDPPSSGLGYSGTSDYNNFYLSSAVSIAAQVSARVARESGGPVPHIGLNVAELKGNLIQMQANGVQLGGQGNTFPLTDTSHGELHSYSIRQIGPTIRAQPDVLPPSAVHDAPMLADNPAHADHATFARIHDWVQGTGNWSADEARNVSASLYRQQAEDPMMKHVDQVTGAVGRDGAHNVFAVHSPFGEAGPHFHAHVDGQRAAQIPAQQSLEQAEVLRQIQSVQHTQERTQQLTEVQAQPMRGP